MTPNADRIAQFRKMATDDPENDLGHYRLGQALLEAGQFAEAAQSFKRTIELSPQFSKSYQLLGDCLVKSGDKDAAIKFLKDGYSVANERGDKIPRDEMEKMLIALGEAPPAPKIEAPPPAAGDGFRCQRPGCTAGGHAHQLARPPMNDDLGRKIHENVCADCWERVWLRDLSVKVINEMRLDLSTEQGAEMYDNIMKETLGLS